jgi:hypothetical protein
MDQKDSPDRTEPTLASEPAESSEASEPAEPIDRIEPADPMDRIEPLDPMDKMDPLEPILRIDPDEPGRHCERSSLRMKPILAAKVDQRVADPGRSRIIAMIVGRKR